MLVSPGMGPSGMCEVFVLRVPCGDAQEVTKQLQCDLLTCILGSRLVGEEGCDLCGGRVFQLWRAGYQCMASS